MVSKINIAIDGPSGVGKSTIADLVAEQLHMIHLDTGAMYRCVAYYLLKHDINVDHEDELVKALNSIQIRFEGQRVFLNGSDVSDEIRTNKISMATSKIATNAIVREKMVHLQQEITRSKGYIVDGRDICSVVLPEAEVKIYMDASSKARAERRYKEYINQGIDADYEVIYQDIVARDYQDSHRKISPLIRSEDSTLIDTSNLSIQDVVDQVLDIVDRAK